MKTPKSVQSSEDLSHLSIPDAEEIIEEALNDLGFSADSGTARALRFLAPPGYQAIVELCGENGRSKRRNATADSWSPEEDEVRIYFERIDGEEPSPRLSRVSRPIASRAAEEVDEIEEVSPADLDVRVKELCAALAEAERGGQVDRVQRPDRGRVKLRRPLANLAAQRQQPHRGKLNTGGSSVTAATAGRAQHLDLEDLRGDESLDTLQCREQGGRLGLGEHQLDERRGIHIDELSRH
jgi:hypothetical protein